MTVPLPPEQTIPDLKRIIEDAILNHPRSLQVALGPSEIGTACDKCLIAMLAGTAPPEYAAWLPTIGTAVHEWLEWTLLKHLAATGSDRYITEGAVTVGHVGGQEISGHSDLFDVHTGTVVDYKLVGTTTLRDVARHGPKKTYLRQAHLYARGWALKGYDVRSVAVWFLPRNGLTIGAGYPHQEPYDEQMALDTLARADMFASAIAVHGVDTVLGMAGPHTGDEFTCPELEEKKVARTAKQLEGLLAS